MLTQRLGSDTQKDPQFLDMFIGIVKNNPKSCDEVWLSADYGFPKVETHIKSAEILTEVASKLRNEGLRVSLQISNTIGHGQYMSSEDCTGLVYENSPAEKMVGHDGTVADYCFCWNGKNFRKYTFSYIKEYVKRIKPYCVWIDDDLRASNHNPVEYGCFCDDCISRFNSKYGSNFTREELVKEINFGNKIWRERHIKFIRDSLYDFTFEMGKVIHVASPESKMGYQYGVNKMIIGYNCNFIFDAMYKSTGYPPLSRPGGGSYDDHDMNTFVEKSESLDMLNMMLPAYVKDKRPEIESLPDIVYGKSIGGTCFETSYYLASGNNAMSYAILMNDYEKPEWHNEMLSTFSKHRKYWEKLSNGAENTQQGGMVYAISKVGHMRDVEEEMDYSYPCFDRVRNFRYLGFSVAMKENAEDNEVRLLHFDNAEDMSDEELGNLLNCPVITDAKTIALLNKRGFNLPVDSKSISTLTLSERFTDHSVNTGMESRRWNGQFCADNSYEIISLNDSQVEILSEYVKVTPPDTPDSECVYMANCGKLKYKKVNKIANAIFTTPQGAKWAVFGFDMWSRTISSEKKDIYLNTAAYISGKRQPAEIITPIKALLQSRVNNEDKLTQVSITNITVAESGEVEINVSDPVSQKAVLMGQYTPEQEIAVLPTETEGMFKIKIPYLKPWAVSTIFFE